jgi:hypothetical protein
MDQADKTRITKLIGMLGSAFDGERANAAAMLSKMAESRKQTINELIAEALGATTSSRPPPPPPPPRQKPRPEPDADLLNLLRRIAANAAIAAQVLTDWEISFSRDVGDRYRADYELSARQLAIIVKILRKAARVFP